MKKAGYAIGKSLRSLPVMILLLSFSALYALDSSAVIPEPAPGIYASPVLVSFHIPSGTRLQVSVDGAPFSEPGARLLLSASPGEEKTCVVETRLLPLLPGSPVIEARRFVWRIDLKSPPAPVLTVKKADGGRDITCTLAEPGAIHYQIWHPYFKSRSEGSIVSGAHVFLPDGASLCAIGIDLAGNRSPAVSPGIFLPNTDTLPFRVINPVSGTWANKQILLVDTAPGTEVYYSLDGSDPATSGQVYDGPVLLDSSGIAALRILAVDAAGKRYSDRILYTVQESGSSVPSGFPADTSLVSTGEFAEIAVPEGFSYAIGDSLPSNPGGKSILFTAVRGLTRYYPFVLSDGKHTWRFVCASGASAGKPVIHTAPVVAPGVADESAVKGAASGDSIADTVHSAGAATEAASPSAAADSGRTVTEPKNEPESPLAVSGERKENPAADQKTQKPEIRILDWYFVSIDYSSPLYYSLDGKTWVLYTEPVFVDRRSAETLRWYSDTWKAGSLQTVSLPVKPEISGISSGDITANPVFLTVSSSEYTFRYQAGAFFPPALPGESSPLLASGLLVEVPGDTDSPFTVRFLAEHDGLVHGELYSAFDLDRKAPRTPGLGIDPALIWSRNPVVLSPSGEDMIQLAIEPSLFSRRGNSFVLEGNQTHPVSYTVTAFSVDRAGNKSGVNVQKVTVDLNALFVDGSSASLESASTVRNGSPSAPFTTLDDALDAIQGSGDWRISISGTVRLEKPHTIQTRLRITGQKAEIIAGEAACLSVSGGSLAISDCDIRQQNGLGGNKTMLVRQGQPAVLFDIQNGSFSASSLDVELTGGAEGSLLRASGSQLSCSDSRFALDAADYALLFDIRKSSVKIDSCHLSAKARTSSVLSLTGSVATITGSSLSVFSLVAARSIEAWDSRLTLQNLVLERQDAAAQKKGTGNRSARTEDGSGANPGDEAGSASASRDTAFWLDAQSRILSEKDITVNGFWRYKSLGTR